MATLRHSALAALVSALLLAFPLMAPLAHASSPVAGTWHALGPGLTDFVYAVAAWGTDLYVGGSFLAAGGVPGADYLARWDGAAWHPLGKGLNATANALAPSGSDLYVGGSFTAPLSGIDRIARWDGAWHAVGGGLSDTVYSLAAAGANVYAGGLFTDAGGSLGADGVARFDGAAWNAMVKGLNNSVTALAVEGANVYAGGLFTDAGGERGADRIARWGGIDYERFLPVVMR